MTHIGVWPDGTLAQIPLATQTGEDTPATPGLGASVDVAAQVGPVGFELFGQLGAAISALNGHLDTMRRDRGRPRIPGYAVTPLYIPEAQIAITSGAGSLDQRQLFGPTLGRTWVIYSAIARGYTAGTVQGLRNGIDLMLPFAAAGELTYGKCQKILRGNGERIVWTASGITLATGFTGVNVSIAGLSVTDDFWADFAL